MRVVDALKRQLALMGELAVKIEFFCDGTGDNGLSRTTEIPVFPAASREKSISHYLKIK